MVRLAVGILVVSVLASPTTLAIQPSTGFVRPLDVPRANAFTRYASTLDRKTGPSSGVKEQGIPKSGASGRSAISEQMRQVRSEMEQDEKMKLLMQGLRGTGVNDDDAAAEGVEMLVVEIEEGEDRLPLSYQPEKLEAYFKKRPDAVRKRLLQIFGTSSGFMAKIALDVAQNRLDEVEVKRTAELREIITALGPFFIKLGQALSIRPDILSPKAMVELQKLCDKVPSYDNKLAMATIEKELGKPVDEIFSELTTDPIAAASLGQVYKGKLRANGKSVAVKVQRPFVLETVSLDLYLMRQLGLNLRKVPFLKDRTDLVALIDEFAGRFYDELDYNMECQNGLRMVKNMADIPQVVVPVPYPEFTSRRVHVAEWLDGEKLSQSTADDVQELVNVGVVAYLTQLLDSGFFHADPHPGNLIRTPDGRLAILDFGLMTEITDDQKYGMIEAISHLVHRDYSRIGEDFVKLGFIPPGTDLKPIIPALTKVFDAALAGGGAKSINFNDLSADLAEITFSLPFRIPPYFALIIRAIGVLEGIALVGNPGFAIIDEAYPYISKRLLTDDSPRLRAALRYMIYGRDNSFDVDRLIDLLQAFEALEAVRATPTGSARPGMGGPVGDGSKADNVRDALRFFFADEGRFFREFLLDEVVNGVDAVSRDGLRELAVGLGFQGPLVPPVFRALVPKLSTSDRQVVRNVEKLLGFFLGAGQEGFSLSSLLSPASFFNPLGNAQRGGVMLAGMRGGASPLTPRMAMSSVRSQVQMANELAPVFTELGPQMRDFGLQIVSRLNDRMTSRFLRFAKDTLLGPA